MPKVNVNKKRGYAASVAIEKAWTKIRDTGNYHSWIVPLGENAQKEDFYIDIGDNGHIFALGSALSGAGMFRRVTLATLLHFHAPHELQIILIDPLKIAFIHFHNILNDYLTFPVITDVDHAYDAIQWCKWESSRRKALMQEIMAPDLFTYNIRNPKKHLPHIVILISEWGEMTDFYSASELEYLCGEILSPVSHTGIHMIMTSQRPSTDVITDIVKDLVPIKIAFQLPGEKESVDFLRIAGAEKLLGQGDMLVLDMRQQIPIQRLQGYCLEEEEIEEMIAH